MAERAVREKAAPVGLRQRGEGLAAALLYRFFALLPLDAASALGGRLGRLAGRVLGRATARARRNLERHMPELTPAQRDEVIGGMWEQMGRTAAELPHLARLRLSDRPGGRIELVGAEHLEALARSGRSVLLFSGHVGNWELLPLVSRQLGLPLHVVYRAINNPLINEIAGRTRAVGAAGAVPKGAEGARMLLKLLKQGAAVGILIDQKMNDGIAVPFFGEPAMTAPALAQLALRFRAPVVPGRCERLQGARFRVTVYPPLALPQSGDRAADTAAIMREANAMLETWIRERPEQWLWMHRRWPSSR